MKMILPALLLFVSTSLVAQPPTAEHIIANARKEAAVSGKNIFVIFHASWCIWCHRMDSAMNEPALKPLFQKNYIIEHLTVMESPGKKSLENPGADAMLGEYHGKDGGIPFWLILDKNGKLLADSRGPQADGSRRNVGCPAAPAELAYFGEVLQKTTHLTEDQIDIIKKRFSKFDSGH